jgi:hypothetical protein
MGVADRNLARPYEDPVIPRPPEPPPTVTNDNDHQQLTQNKEEQNSVEERHKFNTWSKGPVLQCRKDREDGQEVIKNNNYLQTFVQTNGKFKSHDVLEYVAKAKAAYSTRLKRQCSEQRRSYAEEEEEEFDRPDDTRYLTSRKQRGTIKCLLASQELKMQKKVYSAGGSSMRMQ